MSITVNEFKVKLDNVANFNPTAALQQSCMLVERAAKLNCPVATGILRDSIESKVSGNTGVVGTNVEYAPYVEYGTGIWAANGDGRQEPWSYQDAYGEWHTTIGQQPQPFLYPALEDNREKIVQIFKEAIKQELIK